MIKRYKLDMISAWLCCLLFLLGCAGDKYYVEIDDIVSNETDSTQQKLVPLTFTASVGAKSFSELSETKGLYTPDTIQLPKGRVVHMFIYPSGKTPLNSSPMVFSILQAAYEGMITPLTGQYVIALPPGYYNLYAISELNNPSDKTPPFVNGNGYGGKMTGLYNELDYLWWSATNVEVSSISNPPTNIVFEQISTQIQINMSASSGNKISKIYQATIQTPSTQGLTLQLANGTITPSNNVTSTTTNLTIVDTNLYVNFVPFTTRSRLKVLVNIVFNNRSGWMSFSLPLPAYGKFKQENAYIYNVILRSWSQAPEIILQEVDRNGTIEEITFPITD